MPEIAGIPLVINRQSIEDTRDRDFPFRKKSTARRKNPMKNAENSKPYPPNGIDLWEKVAS
jgi:hypothetical protein